MATETQEKPKRTKKTENGYEMGADHKKALAEGREQSRVVREYLVALSNNRPKRGRKRTTESVEKRLNEVIERIALESDPLRRLQLSTERDSLQNELANMQDSVNTSELEDAFVRVAAAYSHRKGISYSAWRDAGVTPEVLRKAGVSRSA